MGFMVYEFNSCHAKYLRKARGPFSEQEMKKVCAELKQKYIWHVAVDLHDIDLSVPEEGVFRTELLKLVEKATTKPTVKNLKSVVRHLNRIGFYSHMHPVGIERKLGCPETYAEGQCRNCSYLSSSVGIMPIISSVINTVFSGGNALIIQHRVSYCKCSIIGAKIVLQSLGISHINSSNSGIILNLMVYLKAILENPPFISLRGDQEKENE